MADVEAAAQQSPAALALPAPGPLDGEQPPVRMAEVENALSVLEREAVVNDETLKLLRKAVNDNLSTPRPLETQNDDCNDIGGARKRPFKPASSKRQQLTAEEAAEIYKQRPQPGKGGTLRRGSMLHCKQVAPKYGVTPKTIRDVWSGRSWAEATRPLWTEEEIKRRSANEEDSKHSMERLGGTPSAGLHTDDPTRMMTYPYMPGMGSCGMVGGHMLHWGAGGAHGAFPPPGYMPSVTLANMAGLGIMSAHTLAGMPGGFHMVQQQAHQNGASSQQQMMGSHPMNATHPGPGQTYTNKGMLEEIKIEGGGSMNGGGAGGGGMPQSASALSARTSDSEDQGGRGEQMMGSGGQSWGEQRPAPPRDQVFLE